MKDLTVFILTHNRGEMILETIDSVLKQTCHDFKFVVSDNSSNDETFRLLSDNNLLSKFEYKKRDIEYPSLDHFNLCLSEVNTKYFVLFHDDDIMLPNYIETMYNEISNSDYIAVGCNAYYLNDTKITSKKILNTYKHTLCLSDKEIVHQYCKNNIVPYPSYIYNKEMIGNIKFDSSCGKYSDVSWLLNLSKKGNILWLSTPYINYRIHKGQDSKSFDLENQIKLFTRFSEICGENKRIIKNYRCNLDYSEIILIYKEKNVFDKKKFLNLFKKSKKYALKTLIKIFQLKLLYKS